MHRVFPIKAKMCLSEKSLSAFSDLGTCSSQKSHGLPLLPAWLKFSWWRHSREGQEKERGWEEEEKEEGQSGQWQWGCKELLCFFFKTTYFWLILGDGSVPFPSSGGGGFPILFWSKPAQSLPVAANEPQTKPFQHCLPFSRHQQPVVGGTCIAKNAITLSTRAQDICWHVMSFTRIPCIILSCSSSPPSSAFLPWLSLTF